MRNLLGIRSVREMAQLESEALYKATERAIDEAQLSQHFDADDIRHIIGQAYARLTRAADTGWDLREDEAALRAKDAALKGLLDELFGKWDGREARRGRRTESRAKRSNSTWKVKRCEV